MSTSPSSRPSNTSVSLTSSPSPVWLLPPNARSAAFWSSQKSPSNASKPLPSTPALAPPPPSSASSLPSTGGSPPRLSTPNPIPPKCSTTRTQRSSSAIPHFASPSKWINSPAKRPAANAAARAVISTKCPSPATNQYSST